MIFFSPIGNKNSRPAFPHRSAERIMILYKYILPLLKKTVKAAAVAVGVYIVAAIAALNVSAVVVGVLLENALIGAAMKLEA